MISIDSQDMIKINKFIQGVADHLEIPFNEVGREWETFAVHQNAEFKPSDIVLEFGAWPRLVADYTAQFVNKIYATDSFDWSENRADEFELFLSRSRWESRFKKAITQKVDIRFTEYPNKYFDKIISYSVLEHIENATIAIHEICRILKDDGIVSMTIDMKYGEEIPYDRATRGGAYTKKSLETLINNSGLKFAEDNFCNWWQDGTLPENQIFPMAVKLIKR